MWKELCDELPNWKRSQLSSSVADEELLDTDALDAWVLDARVLDAWVLDGEPAGDGVVTARGVVADADCGAACADRWGCSAASGTMRKSVASALMSVRPR